MQAKRVPVFFDQKKSTHDNNLKKFLQILYKNGEIERYVFDIVSGKPKIRVTEEKKKGAKREKVTVWRAVEMEDLEENASEKSLEEFSKFLHLKKRRS